MKKYLIFLLVVFSYATSISNLFAQQPAKWRVAAGIRGFKYSVYNQPQELNYNPVFLRWEHINQNPTAYSVSEYKPLEPLFFNMNFGVDLFICYKKHLLIKIGYDYSNPMGIGGTGNISYTDIATGNSFSETKEFSYTSHQINYFIGPIVTVGEDASEFYLGFSMMSPTWVTYKEKYTKISNGNTVTEYDKTFKGFFGNCRALIGMQVPITKKLKIGSEAVFSYFNGIELKSGDIKDEGFRFPNMKWDVTLRYEIF